MVNRRREFLIWEILLAAQAKPREQTPTARAILLANALKIEAMLMTGEYKNASELARAIGVSKKYLSEFRRETRS